VLVSGKQEAGDVQAHGPMLPKGRGWSQAGPTGATGGAGGEAAAAALVHGSDGVAG
jgi:hypothetical protein